MILNGGFVENEEAASWQRSGYDMISETNAGNYSVRRNLERLRYTKGRYSGYELLLLEDAAYGAVHSGGPGST